MKRVIMFLFIALVTSPVVSWSQYYQYTDKNGVVHFTDNPGNVPDEQKKAVKTVKEAQTNSGDRVNKDAAIREGLPRRDEKCRFSLEDNLSNCRSLFKKVETLKANEIVSMVTFCGHPLLRDMLTVQEKALLSKKSPQTENARKGLTPKELNDIELLAKYFYSDCQSEEEKTYSKNELDELDNVLKDIWKKMSEALAQNDLETAASYYAEAYQEPWKKRFKTFTPEVRAKIAQDNLEAQLHLEKVQGNRATCHLITTRDGKRHSFQLTFVKNSQSEWKIQSF